MPRRLPAAAKSVTEPIYPVCDTPLSRSARRYRNDVDITVLMCDRAEAGATAILYQSVNMAQVKKFLSRGHNSVRKTEELSPSFIFSWTNIDNISV